ncbi:MAG: inner-membrane translocator [Thermoleophilia bacterium]|nr:inner-membrane translocator [Thermoleophilia bacterium]
MPQAVPKEHEVLVGVDGRILQDEVKPLVDAEIIEEHRRNPIGFHTDELERVLIYLRKHQLQQEGKLVIVCTKPHKEWCIGVLSGVRGIPPTILRDQVFSSREEAEHGIFLKRIKDLGLV